MKNRLILQKFNRLEKLLVRTLLVGIINIFNMKSDLILQKHNITILLKEKVIQGTTCMCNFWIIPNTLKVLTKSKYYVNNDKGKKKLAATHKDIGTTFEKNTFGSCKKINNKLCKVSVIKWSGYYEKEKHSLPDSYPTRK